MRRRCCCGGGGGTPFTCDCVLAIRPAPLYFTGKSTADGNWYTYTFTYNATLNQWRYLSVVDWRIGCVGGALFLTWGTGLSMTWPPSNPSNVYTCSPFSLSAPSASGAGFPSFAPIIISQ